MKPFNLCLSLGILLSAGLTAAQEPQPVELTLNPDKIENRIDENIYGHFLEHIYHSCNGGLWGELIWNRSFEQNSAGQWSIQDDQVRQDGQGTNQRLYIGDPDWRDYEFTLEARKTGGQEGFLILFRVRNEQEFYWCNLGGWGNQYHRLERGLRQGNRWGAIGPQANGRIESDRWYAIKVRCQGPHIQVWLDKDLIIDFTDDQQAHLSGGVGIGTWSTQAVFRNLKVTDLAGKVLFEGTPSVLIDDQVASSWKSFGNGQFLLERADPLNSAYSQKITAAAAPAGLRQDSLVLRSGETYLGSFWARSDKPAGLQVRFLANDQVLYEKSFPAPGSAWKQYAFEYPCRTDAKDATIQLSVAASGSAYLDQVSLMPASWHQADGFRPDLLDAVAELHPPVIRWPGGCFASAYRWKAGIGPQHKRAVYPREIWDDLDVNSFGTDEFVAMCRKVGAEPLIVVNIGTANWNGPVKEEDFLQEVCDWIEYCNGPADSPGGRLRAANGHPEPYRVKYWEIDNETWHLGAENYAAAVQRFAPRMKQADPSIILAACGSAGYGRRGNGLAWNQTIIERCAEMIDYLSIHHYENPDNFREGPLRYEQFFGETAELIRQSKNPDLKIYVSEWNAQSTDWRTGLYAGGLLNAFERSGAYLQLAGPALFLRHVSASAWDNAFINFDAAGWFAAPNYVVMKLWRDHFGPQRVELTGPAEDLNLSASKSADGRQVYLKAVNPAAQPQAVKLHVASGFPIGAAELQLIDPPSLRARNSLAQPAAIQPHKATTSVSGQEIRFTLPAYSAGVLSINRR
ncbi:MAG: DUF1080 domain-containing protein [Sedimentisphaerales bacterium]|nr:DUF1080 domain-containing protein [Sedimentisphaerales bacterium]